jgi:amidase
LIDAEENTSGMMEEAIYQEVLKDRDDCRIKIREQIKDLDLCIMLSYNNIMHYTALPIITIPCGLYKDGMPFGIMMSAKTDVELIGHAYAVDRIIGHRVEPKIVS